MFSFFITIIDTQRRSAVKADNAAAAGHPDTVTVEIKDMLAGRNADGTVRRNVRVQFERTAGRPVGAARRVGDVVKIPGHAVFFNRRGHELDLTAAGGRDRTAAAAEARGIEIIQQRGDALSRGKGNRIESRAASVGAGEQAVLE